MTAIGHGGTNCYLLLLVPADAVVVDTNWFAYGPPRKRYPHSLPLRCGASPVIGPLAVLTSSPGLAGPLSG